jgi:hypothetical protein
MAYCEIPPKEEGTKAPTAIHGPLGPEFYSSEEANVTAKSLENLFTPHKLCDADHERRVETRVQALLNTVEENLSTKSRPCDVSK